MITVEQILQAEGDELSRLAGEVLRGDMRLNHDEDRSGRCRKCLCRCGEDGWQVECIAVPIPLTPNNAFKWRDWAVEKFGWQSLDQCLYSIYAEQLVLGGIYSWMEWMLNLKPEHYIKAACLCVLQ